MKIFNIFALSAAVFAQSEGDYDGDYGPDGYTAPMAGLKSSSKIKYLNRFNFRWLKITL